MIFGGSKLTAPDFVWRYESFLPLVEIVECVYPINVWEESEYLEPVADRQSLGGRKGSPR